MNLILLQPGDFIADDRAQLRGRRCRHITQVQGAIPGRRLRVGLLNGPMGRGEVIAASASAVTLRVELDTPPPPPRPLTLVLGLARPKAMRRIFRTIAELGIKHVVVLHCWRVEKSFWQSPLLAPQAVHDNLLEGLEQARDTCLPQIEFRRRFKPFVEDELPALTRDRRSLVAHPRPDSPPPPPDHRPGLLAIGPEGGFIPYEIERLIASGCEPVDLGPRILRVENAITLAVARMSAG